MGRPSLYTPDMIESIADRLSQGVPLAVICRTDGMPAYRTVKDWIDGMPDVSAAIARAREEGFDMIAAECLPIIDNIQEDPASRRVRMEGRLKLLKVWDPKRYGDRQVLAGDPDAPLGGLSEQQVEDRLAALMAKRGEG